MRTPTRPALASCHGATVEPYRCATVLRSRSAGPAAAGTVHVCVACGSNSEDQSSGSFGLQPWLERCRSHDQGRHTALASQSPAAATPRAVAQISWGLTPTAAPVGCVCATMTPSPSTGYPGGCAGSEADMSHCCTGKQLGTLWRLTPVFGPEGRLVYLGITPRNGAPCVPARRGSQGVRRCWG